MRRTILWHAVTGLVLSGLVTLSSGCRKELCYNHDEHAYSVKVDVTATWEREWERDHGRGWKNTWEGRGWNNWMTYDDLRPEVPGGIRAVVYDPDGNRHDERNLAAEGGRLAMTEGRHSILFYNNNTEYIVFNDLTSSATATATTRTRTRAGFSELHKDERTVGQPDMLYGSYLGEYEAKPGYEAVSLPWNCARWSTPTWYVVSSATEPNTCAGPRSTGGYGRERLPAGRAHGQRGSPRCSSMPPSATGARGRRYVRSASPTGRATDIPGLLTATTPCSSKCA